jgi:hypothetical protein
MQYKEMEPQMNADERGFIITLSENLLLYSKIFLSNFRVTNPCNIIY